MLLRPLFVIFSFVVLTGSMRSLLAQEFIDTLGRWKELDLSSVSQSGAMPRCILAHRGVVLVGREEGSILRGTDTGEVWAEVGAGNGAPANLTTTWDLAFLDTATQPNVVYGIARIGGGTPYGTLIVSTDGGVTWSESTPLPFLNAYLGRPVDSIQMFGRPRIAFLRDTVSNRRAALLWCGAGLWRSEDTGRTWTKDPNIASVYDLWMIDRYVGAGFVKMVGDIYLGDIASTRDGGLTWRSSLRIPDDQNRFPLGYAFQGESIRIIVPDRHKNFARWAYFATDNRCLSWERRDHAPALRPLWGTAIWLDTADIHLVGDGMSLQHSPNGSATFVLLHDTVENYIQNDLSVYVLPKAPISARDNRYIYSVGPNDRAFRWRYAEPGPRLRASVPYASDQTTIEHVGDRLIVRGGVDVRLVDMLGRSLFECEVTPDPISLAGLRTGLYYAVVRSLDRTVRSVPLVLVR